MPRVLVADPIAQDGVAILREVADVDVRTGLPSEELLRAIPEYDALVVRSETKVTAAVLAAASKLQVVGRAGVGVDNIDVAAATQRGVVVVYAPEGNTISAAEHTIALMMALARHIPAAHGSLSQGKWERSKFVGVEVRGKTLGLFGLGRVGSEVARRARGLDMNVIGLDPFVTPERALALGIRLGSKDEILAESDFISLHVPLNAENRNLLGAAEFTKTKKDVRIINVARGGLIDEAALIEAMDAGKVAGAAFDVFDPEPPAADSPILAHPRVIVTPHLGASTAEAQERVAVDVAKQIVAVLRGEPATYSVNLPALGAETYKVLAPYMQAVTQAASLASQLSSGQLNSVEIEYQGDLADLDTTPLKASVIKGLLARSSEENISLVNANLVAEQRGLRITELKGGADSGVYKDLIRVHLKTSDGTTRVSATVAHDGTHIVEVNDFWVDVSPGHGYLLFCENQDRPGMIGSIGTFLGAKDINISFMRVGREAVRGRALMVLGLDDEIDAETLAEIARIPNIFTARTARI